MKYAPIALFTYCRPLHTLKTVEALKKNFLASESDLIVYSDSPRTATDTTGVQEVREYLRTITGFKSLKIVERTENFGLAKSIMDGVTRVVSEFGRVIVIEDDLITSPYFLTFMNQGLEVYQNDEQVASIHGFIYPIKRLPETFFIKGADCWGWATWERAWKHFNPDGAELLRELQNRSLCSEFDFCNQYPYTQMLKDQIAGKNNSWAIRWMASAFLNEMLTLYPGKSLVRNIGFDRGTHFKNSVGGPEFGVLFEGEIAVNRIPIAQNEQAYLKLSGYFRGQRKSVFVRFLQRIKKIMRDLGSS